MELNSGTRCIGAPETDPILNRPLDGLQRVELEAATPT